MHPHPNKFTLNYTNVETPHVKNYNNNYYNQITKARQQDLYYTHTHTHKYACMHTYTHTQATSIN